MLAKKHFWATRNWRDYIFNGYLRDLGWKGELREK